MWPKAMKKLSTWFYKISIGWVALSSLVIFLAFTALVLPRQSAQADLISGDVGSPDMSFLYTPKELYDMADAYGDQGRAAYIRARFSFDLIWPIVYTLFLSTAISWIFARSFPPESRWRWANLTPLIGMLFDYLENISTSIVMYRYPTLTPLIAWAAPLFTAVKWIFVSGSFGLLLIGVPIALLQRAREAP
jgi:hypothetical protein